VTAWREGWDNAVARFSDRRVLGALLVASLLYSFAFVMLEGPLHRDWNVLERAAEAAGTPELYRYNGSTTYVWSPVAAYPLKIIAPLGVTAWRLILIATALALPTWRLRLLVLASVPFWVDMATGNLTILVFVSAVYALRGSPLGTASFFGFALLIPRPLFAPMVLWLLWKRPGWRVPIAVAFGLHLVLVWWTGLGVTWIETVLEIGPELQGNLSNIGPSRLVGLWWLAAGIPLGAWLFSRGQLGWAGLAVSPYIWPYYLYWALPQVNLGGRRRVDEEEIGEHGSEPRH